MMSVHVVTARVEEQGLVPVALCGSPLRDVYVRTLGGLGKASSLVCPVCVAIAQQRSASTTEGPTEPH
jgi:hypothetical protein